MLKKEIKERRQKIERYTNYDNVKNPMKLDLILDILESMAPETEEKQDDSFDIIHCKKCCYVNKMDLFLEDGAGDRHCPKCGASPVGGNLDFIFFH